MEQILKDLEQNFILNDEIVVDIQQDIRRNHPTSDSEYRARLLAQYLHEIIDEQLYGLSDQQRTEVRTSIFKKSIESNHLNVSQKDLLHQITKASIQGEEMLSYLSNWFQSYVDINIKSDQLYNVILTMNPDVRLEETIEVSKIPTEKLSSRIRRYSSSIITELKQTYNSRSYKLMIILFATILALPLFYFTKNVLLEEPKPRLMTFVHASSIIRFEPNYKKLLDTTVVDIFYRERPGFPDFLKYTNTSYTDIVTYLHSRNSSLTSAEYLDIIDLTASDYDVHPLLLLAIIGQEQGFVPRDNPYAARILNNPFNVYTSWTNYNTDLKDSCEVAAGTIRNILRERPVGENPFKWLNTRYAEDPNWWKGVQELFYTLLAHSEV